MFGLLKPKSSGSDVLAPHVSVATTSVWTQRIQDDGWCGVWKKRVDLRVWTAR